VRIKLASVFVSDQEKALQFYTEVLGFEKKRDIPIGKDRWLTGASPEGPSVELLLEPVGFDPARTYQKALFDAGIPQNEAYQDGARHRRCTGRHVRQPDPDCAGEEQRLKLAPG